MIIQPPGMFPNKPWVRWSVLQDDYIDAGLWKGGIARLDLTQKPGSWYNMADPLEPGMPGNPWPLEGLGGRTWWFFSMSGKLQMNLEVFGYATKNGIEFQSKFGLASEAARCTRFCLIDGHRETQQIRNTASNSCGQMKVTGLMSHIFTSP